MNVTAIAGSYECSSSPLSARRATFLRFGVPQITEDEIAGVVEVLRSGWLGPGPLVHRFEEEFREYVGARAAVAVNSCTAALHLALLTAGIKPGDEVITTPMTFCATANAIIHCGAIPVFADCTLHDSNINPVEVLKKITPRTRALLPVHLAGRPCQMRALMALAREHNVKVIEDCAHAIETEIDGRHAGTLGDFGCFSFYATKNVTTGEGGMLVTDCPEVSERIRVLASNGISRSPGCRAGGEVVAAGFPYAMTDLQAALGLRQLEKVEKYWRRRKQIWHTYQEAFSDLPCQVPPPPEKNTLHGYHLFTLLLDLESLECSRDQVLAALALEKIGASVHYRSLHLHPYYAARCGLAPGDFPNALAISERTLSLPLSAGLIDGDVQDVIQAVRKVLLAHVIC